MDFRDPFCRLKADRWRGSMQAELSKDSWGAYVSHSSSDGITNSSIASKPLFKDIFARHDGIGVHPAFKSELSAANDSWAFPQAPISSPSQLFSSRNIRNHQVKRSCRQSHKAPSPCIRHAIRAEPGKRDKSRAALMPATSAWYIRPSCLVCRNANCHSPSTVPAPLLQSSDQGSASMTHQALKVWAISSRDCISTLYLQIAKPHAYMEVPVIQIRYCLALLGC
ncbi:uncharacterized protein BO96DRAFT_463443 [Aspergillus niger CBS 101883]|uniref:Uncharacterized protein n=2 Tax=Aspergillus niger TaxID=5061 RepID=A2R254_ASPNC|nr:uncharacterized protein BO96DRAFT_463443 [Aspergillus niger CBS 101883]XP_059602184.1 hypothetical protein An13g03580 [Aspergillus niger]PYH59939.1 hypothetical protein BO96DRAFT_463443 [Aspergillus niger CBS 101883]CAK41754.1 hypothetical protein An13g03580 [Aspergillus niger]